MCLWILPSAALSPSSSCSWQGELLEGFCGLAGAAFSVLSNPYLSRWHAGQLLSPCSACIPHGMSDVFLLSSCAAAPTDPEAVVKKYLVEVKGTPADEVRSCGGVHELSSCSIRCCTVAFSLLSCSPGLYHLHGEAGLSFRLQRRL